MPKIPLILELHAKDALGNAAQISPLPDYAALSIITRHCHYLSQATR